MNTYEVRRGAVRGAIDHATVSRNLVLATVGSTPVLIGIVR